MFGGLGCEVHRMSESALTIRTARLCLEPITAEHAPRVFSVLTDPTIYTYTPGDAPASVASLRERYELLERRVSPSGDEVWLNWAVWVESERAYAGAVQATVRGDRSALLAYELGRAFRGVGYASEACGAVLVSLAALHSVERVLAYVDTRNQASIRLLERLGFEQMERVVKADHFKGSWSDEFVYSRLLPGGPPN